MRKRSKFTEYKYVQEEIVKELDFAPYFTEDEEIQSAYVTVKNGETLKDWTDEALEEDTPMIDGFKISFFLSSFLPIGSYVVQAIAESDVQKRIIAFNLIVDEVFNA